MNYWLIKSDPETYTFDQMKADRTTGWDGVRNFAARNNLKAMKKGDICLFYHSNDPAGIVGLVEVVREFYPDATAKEGDWVAVDVRYKKAFKYNISLAQVKKNSQLQQMQLIRLQRLSVQAVTPDEFGVICHLGDHGK